MNEELQKYIEALRQHTNNARYVQLRLSDGNLTSPMSIEDAAVYIYSDNKPQTKTLPSEQVAAQQDKQWAAREAARQADQARTRANEYNTRTFYTDVALPTITLGLSKFIPGLEGTANSVTDPLLASSLAVSKSPVGKLFLPAATAAAVWSWYANTHRVPDFRLRTESPEWDYDAGWDIPEDYVPSTATNVGSTQPVSPAASQAVDETVSRSNEQELSPSSQPEQNNDENPNQEPEQKPNKPKKPSKIKEEAKKVGKNIAKGYGKVAKGAAYGLGFVGVPAGIAYGIYKAAQPEPSDADKALEASEKWMKEVVKLQQAARNQERIDSMLNLLEDRGSVNTKAEPGPLPAGFKPVVGYNEKNPNQVVTYSQSGNPDSVINLQPIPNIDRFKKK